MASVTEYMQFALGVYAASDNNKISVPEGWTLVDWQPDKWTGFSAGVFKNDATKNSKGVKSTLDSYCELT